MRSSLPKYRVVLKRKPRKRLEGVVRRRTPSHWCVLRAKIVLLSAAGMSIRATCAALAVDRQVVRRWCKRYLERGFEGLRDNDRSGRPALIWPKTWQKAATLVVQPPSKFGIALNRWSVRELSSFLFARYGMQVGRSSLSRFLRAMALKPHRLRYWLNPTDPDFDQKASQICELYLKPPPRTTVLCLDEKPGIQALERKHPSLSMRPGSPRRMEFEYKRHGTRNVFAAFNIRTGQVLVEVTADRKTPRVLAFLHLICQAYPRGNIILITDNIGTRTGPEAAAWLGHHPRVRFVFTPFHGSWLNQVEIWFSILTAKCLRGRSFHSLRALAAAIRAFARRWNIYMAHPFNWTYTGKVLHA